MAIKSYIQAFTTYPVDTRQMLTATNFCLACASDYAFENDAFEITKDNSKYEWIFDGGIGFMVVFYDTDYNPASQGFTQDWDFTPNPGTLLSRIAASDDLRYISTVGSAEVPIESTINYGTVWTSGSLSTFWADAVMSSDGKYQLFTSFRGHVHTSNDYGTTFSTLTGAGVVRGASMSSDGKYQVYCVSPGGVYKSDDYGASWFRTGLDNGGYYSVAISNDGQYMTAVYNGLYIYTSYDGGSSWTAHDYGAWNNVVMSSDGKYQTACGPNLNLHVSDDYGMTWSKNADVRIWISVSMSDAGNLQLASYPGGLFASNDYGTTWFSITGAVGDWNDVDVSCDGSYAIACNTFGQLLSTRMG